MQFQSNQNLINWKIHLKSSPDKVFWFLTTDEGRNKFWAHTSENVADQTIKFQFPNGFEWDGKILNTIQNQEFSVVYIDNSHTTFILKSDNEGGTDLELIDKGVAEKYRCEVIAGWGSVLMALKGAVDHNVDLRNNDSKRTWNHGYFDN